MAFPRTFSRPPSSGRSARRRASSCTKGNRCRQSATSCFKRPRGAGRRSTKLAVRTKALAIPDAETGRSRARVYHGKRGSRPCTRWCRPGLPGQHGHLQVRLRRHFRNVAKGQPRFLKAARRDGRPGFRSISGGTGRRITAMGLRQTSSRRCNGALNASGLFQGDVEVGPNWAQYSGGASARRTARSSSAGSRDYVWMPRTYNRALLPDRQLHEQRVRQREDDGAHHEGARSERHYWPRRPGPCSSRSRRWSAKDRPRLIPLLWQGKDDRPWAAPNVPRASQQDAGTAGFLTCGSGFLSKS